MNKMHFSSWRPQTLFTIAMIKGFLSNGEKSAIFKFPPYQSILKESYKRNSSVHVAENDNCFATKGTKKS